jgi:hypothetical protein
MKNIEGILILVGSLVNEDNNLGTFFATNGVTDVSVSFIHPASNSVYNILQFPHLVNLSTDELVGFAKTLA